MYEIKHYKTEECPFYEEVIDFMYSYNDEFAKTDNETLVEAANKYWVDEDDDRVEGKDGIRLWYEEICDILVVVLYNQKVVGCRFVDYDEEDEYFRERVENYKQGLNFTFALVDKDYRGNGLWGKMYDYVRKEIAPDYNVNRIYLATSENNDTMQSTAEKVGFNKINTVKNDRGVDNETDTLIYMKKF